MEENEIFKYIERFNALAFAGAATICIFAGIYTVINYLNYLSMKAELLQTTNIVNVGGQEKVSGAFKFGNPVPMTGSDYVRISLMRDPDHQTSSYTGISSSYTEISKDVNYLFLDISNNQSKWLMEKTDQLFVSDVSLQDSLKRDSAEKGKITGLLYALVEQDTDKDGRLTQKDAICLSTSRADGSQYRRLIQGIDKLHSITQISAEKVLVMYQKNDETISALYSIPSMNLISQSAVPQIAFR